MSEPSFPFFVPVDLSRTEEPAPLPERRSARRRRTLTMERAPDRPAAPPPLRSWAETVLETLPEPIVTYDAEGRYSFVNEQAADLLGIDRHKALGKTDRELFGQVALGAHTYVQTALEDQKTTTFMRDLGGRFVNVELRPIIEGGRVVRLVGFPRPLDWSRARTRDLEDALDRRTNELSKLGRALSVEQNLTGAVLDTAEALIVVLDRKGRVLRFNRSCEDLTGKTAEDVLGKPFWSLLPGREAAAARLGFRAMCTSKQVPERLDMASTFGHADAPRQLLWSTTALRSRQGEIDLLVAVGLDLTESRRVEDQARFQSNALQQVNDAVVAIDQDARVTYWNSGAKTLFGYDDAYAEGRHFPASSAWAGWHEADEENAQVALRETGTWRGEIVVKTQEGDERYVESSSSLLRNDEGEYLGLLSVLRDVTDRKKAEDQLLYDSLHDGLTGLPNRTRFLHSLWGAITAHLQNPDFGYAVLFLDLDRFKLVNDSLGHLIGDELLIGFSQRLQDCLDEFSEGLGNRLAVRHDEAMEDEDAERPNQGSILARLSGDEFTILLEDIDSVEDARLLADRIIEVAKLPFELSGHELFTQASIGIVMGHDGYHRPEDLLRDADAAMYAAKAAGKGRASLFHSSLHTENVERLQLEGDLRRAIERDEFEAFYQPLVHMKTGKLKGFETLIRWNHPDQGIIGPFSFIPVAEETGLILEMGAWVLEESCKQLAEWRRRLPEALALTINVNLSRKQLVYPGFVPRLQKILDETGLPPAALMLEITESVVMEGEEFLKKQIPALEAIGVRLAIDDFGTGYSSLALLHQLPIDQLKIDRSFVMRMEDSYEGREIVHTIARLADTLSMASTAEGIETVAQMEAIQALGCEYGQGYLFARPVPTDQAEALIVAPTWTELWG